MDIKYSHISQKGGHRHDGEKPYGGYDSGKSIAFDFPFAVPLSVGNIYQQIYGVVDTMVAGRVLGDRAIAAIGSSGALYGLIIQLPWGLASGFVLVMGQKVVLVISSTLELLMRFFGAVWMVPAFGYHGVAWNNHFTWSVMTVFIFAVCWIKNQKSAQKK